MDDRIARGVNFMYAREYVVREHGEAMWAHIVDQLPPDAARVWRGPLVAIGTYSFGAFKAFASALAAESGGRSDETLSGMYEYIADRSLNALYKVFFRLTNPSFVIGNYPKLWERFFTTGKVEVREATAGRATIEFTLPAIFLDWLPAASLGYSRKAVAMAGGKNLTMRELTRSERGGEQWAIAYELRWQE